jgi:signal peptidase I
MILGISLFLFIAFHAFFTAKKLKEIVSRPYTKWYVYSLVVFLSFIFSTVWEPFLVRELGIKAVRISAGSMIPTLLIDDHVIVDRHCYTTNSPQRGDIIVFRYPVDPKKLFIKRVVAIEGDTIELKNKAVYLNGRAIKEPYAFNADSIIYPCGEKQTEKSFYPKTDIVLYSINTCEQPRDNFGPNKIPRSKYFVMGDNRDQSFDSRYWGYVDEQDIIGKVLYIYWSGYGKRIGWRIE